jgi:hypothetical protein
MPFRRLVVIWICSVPEDAQARHVIGLGLADAMRHAVPDLPPDSYPAMIERYRFHYLSGDHDCCCSMVCRKCWPASRRLATFWQWQRQKSAGIGAGAGSFRFAAAFFGLALR